MHTHSALFHSALFHSATQKAQWFLLLLFFFAFTLAEYVFLGLIPIG
jgi:hypothetical protein